ncbi:hypothetical protein NOCA2300012 [metagenome]|uniref:Uncharacterized protein n=1 Tax=metagenome TaxID=256318 RepID=A0A2P2C188_9ZZZZ
MTDVVTGTSRSEPLLLPRFVPPPGDAIRLHPERAVAGLFVIKFVEGSHVRLAETGLIVDEKAILSNPDEIERLGRVALDAAGAVAELDSLAKVIAMLRELGFEVNALFRAPDFRYSLDDVKADTPFRDKASLEQSAGEELADLDLYYVASCAKFSDLELQQSLMNDLNRSRIIEQVYAAAPATGATTVTPELTSRQGYLDPAPTGLDARYAWTLPGGRGEGVRLIDVEYDWVTDHEDFPPAAQRFWGGRPVAAPYDGVGSEHGTAVLGVIASPDNGSGVTGMAHRVEYGLSSVWRPELIWHGIWATFSGESWAGRTHNVATSNAIHFGAEALRPGDVLLVEQHTLGPMAVPRPPGNNDPQWEFVAMEYYQECFDVIRRATARGVVVVEAAGNGSQNLDSGVYQGRFLPSRRHSGALLVGASTMGDRLPADFSNVSVRVDVHAWGRGVVSIGYGNGDTPPFDSGRPINRFYTPGFSGTSSASAIVAGAVCCVEGALRASGRTPMTPIDIEMLLKSTGTPQEGTAAERDARPIGPQPNLRAALNAALTSTGGFRGPGLYTIRAKHSGKMLDIDIGWFRGQDDGQPAVQFGYHGGLNQQFEVVGQAPGPYWIMPRHSRNKVLEIARGSADDGAPVQQWGMRGGAPEQLFLIEPIGGHFRIVATHTGKVLDVNALSQEDSARVQQWTWWGGDNQLWEFAPARPGGRR